MSNIYDRALSNLIKICFLCLTRKIFKVTRGVRGERGDQFCKN